jgi:hypothetical protein
MTPEQEFLFHHSIPPKDDFLVAEGYAIPDPFFGGRWTAKGLRVRMSLGFRPTYDTHSHTDPRWAQSILANDEAIALLEAPELTEEEVKAAQVLGICNERGERTDNADQLRWRRIS